MVVRWNALARALTGTVPIDEGQQARSWHGFTHWHGVDTTMTLVGVPNRLARVWAALQRNRPWTAAVRWGGVRGCGKRISPRRCHTGTCAGTFVSGVCPGNEQTAIPSPLHCKASRGGEKAFISVPFGAALPTLPLTDSECPRPVRLETFGRAVGHGRETIGIYTSSPCSPVHGAFRAEA
jgi:hypothetical protein